jgi:hypothetical protein
MPAAPQEQRQKFARFRIAFRDQDFASHAHSFFL